MLPSEEEGVSVIITSHNHAEALRKNLPDFLTQSYSNYEVIVVDECSGDNTLEVLAELQQTYPRLRFTRIHPGTKFRYTKKLAINIGVLAARHDLLLFSEVYCRPASPSWLATMSSYFKENTAVVVGYANYGDEEEGVQWKRWFRFVRFIRVLLSADVKQYVTGDGCNLAYRKSCYLKNRGFTLNPQSYIGYDTDMVTSLSKLGEVRVAKEEHSRVVVDKQLMQDEVHEMVYHFAGEARISFAQRLLVNRDRVIRTLCYGLSICLLLLHVMTLPVSVMFFLLILLDISVTIGCAYRLKQKKIGLISLCMSWVGFAWRACWMVYSFCNRKKWR